MKVERKAEECKGIDHIHACVKMQYEGCQYMGLNGLTNSDSTPLFLHGCYHMKKESSRKQIF
jgi:hypothetical protein